MNEIRTRGKVSSVDGGIQIKIDLDEVYSKRDDLLQKGLTPSEIIIEVSPILIYGISVDFERSLEITVR